MNTTDNTGTVATNVLTVDVEDWYMDTDISTWELYEDRVVESTNKIIKLLNESDTKATFFIPGYVAEHFPELVERIRDEDHEVATHGYSHTPITQQTPSEFEEDLLNSAGILEKITGDKVMGYRACQFTVMEETAWAIEVLKKNGLKYDSSVFPVKTHLYGVPDAPLFPYRISPADITKEADPEEDFLEIPLSVYRIPIVHKNIPVAGGFYLRFFPYWFIKHAMKKMSSVVRACERQEGSDWFVLHTGQHYSYGVDRVFFEAMGLPEGGYNLDVGSGSGRHGEQTGRMLAGGMMLWTSLRGFWRVLFGADNIL